MSEQETWAQEFVDYLLLRLQHVQQAEYNDTNYAVCLLYTSPSPRD